MSKAYTELYYHLVWATWKRYPFLKRKVQHDLYRYITHKCEEFGFQAFAVNWMEDHVHVVVRLRSSTAVSEVLRRLKGSSSYFCNNLLRLESRFKWQEGYVAMTFGKRDLKKIVGYVENQKQRHRQTQTDNALEVWD